MYKFTSPYVVQIHTHDAVGLQSGREFETGIKSGENVCN
jgi:hypothetical protein